MERRRLLSVAVNAGVLTMTGSNSADAYIVSRNGTNITVIENGGAVKSFAASGITKLLINLNGGADWVQVKDTVAKNAEINAGAGDDTVLAGGGVDTINGGDGLDTLSYQYRTLGMAGFIEAKLFIPNPADQLGYPYKFTSTGTVIASGNVTQHTDFEILVGGDGNDSLTLGSNSDSHWSQIPETDPRPTYRLDGGAGLDDLYASGANAGINIAFSVYKEIHGGVGNDRLFCYSEPYATLFGEDGNDEFEIGGDDGFPVPVSPGAGIDEVRVYSNLGVNYTMPAGLEIVRTGTPGARVIGNDEANTIIYEGYGASPYIDGRGGNDTINSFGNNDGGTLIGGAGNDTINGSSGNENIDGGADNDLINPGLGNDTIDGGGGYSDVVSYAGRTTPIDARLGIDPIVMRLPDDSVQYDYRGRGTASAAGEQDFFDNVETLVGGSGDDSLGVGTGGGTPEDPWLEQPEARPTFSIFGGPGADELYTVTVGIMSAKYSVPMLASGDEGNDRLSAVYQSHSTLSGGDGDDVFETGGSDSFPAVIDAGAGLDSAEVKSPLPEYGLRKYAMGAGLEDLSFSGGYSVVVNGNELDNRIHVGGRAGITVNGGNGSDSLNAYSSEGGATLNGDGGDDLFEYVASDHVVDGGTGLDTMSFALASDPLTITLNIAASGAATSMATGYGDARSQTSIEGFIGGSAGDTFTLNSPSTSLASTPTLAVRFDGGGGNDSFTLNGLLATGSILQPAVAIDGGSGTDKIVFSDAALSAGGTYDIWPDFYTSRQFLARTTTGGANGAIQFESVSSLNLTMTNFADTISATTSVTKLVLNGGDGVDTFNIDRTDPAIDLNIFSGPGDDVLNMNTDDQDDGGAVVVRLYQSETFGSITLGGGSTLQLAPTPNEATVLRTKNLSFLLGGRLDLTNNPLIIDYTGASPISALKPYLRYASSLVTPESGTAIGVADSSELFPSFPATFIGQSVDSTALLVRYTRTGDANLDRMVNFDDLVRLSQNYNLPNRTYAQGDFNFDGKVDFSDLVTLSQNYGTSLAVPASLLTPAPAPGKAKKDDAAARILS